MPKKSAKKKKGQGESLRIAIVTEDKVNMLSTPLLINMQTLIVHITWHVAVNHRNPVIKYCLQFALFITSLSASQKNADLNANGDALLSCKVSS